MKAKFIDIICPIFNKEDCLDLFLRKIYELDDDIYNVLLIDDGSTDNSKNIISSYLKKNIFYFYKDNGGVSSARNLGLSLSQSEYIWFCDPDDIIDVEQIKYLMKDKDFFLQYDLISFSYHYIDNINGKTYDINHGVINDIIYTDGYSFIQSHDYFSKENDMSTLWNKWYRRVAIIERKFDVELNLSEDRNFNLDVIPSMVNILKLNKYIYHYNAHVSGSLSSNITLSKITDTLKVDDKNIRILSNFLKPNIHIKHSIYNYLKGGVKIKCPYTFNKYRELHENYDIGYFPLHSSRELIFLSLAFLYKIISFFKINKSG